MPSVAGTGIYQGRPQVTLTYPIIDRARRILWLVTGNEKAGPLGRLRDADPFWLVGFVRTRASYLPTAQRQPNWEQAEN
jgi:6-phosphogluconolactonase